MSIGTAPVRKRREPWSPRPSWTGHGLSCTNLVWKGAYLRPHEEAPNYARRLRAGRPIGSGRVESACKTVIGRRLKLNSARWSPRHVAPFASLGALDRSDLWNTYRTARAA